MKTLYHISDLHFGSPFVAEVAEEVLQIAELLSPAEISFLGAARFFFFGGAMSGFMKSAILQRVRTTSG